MTSFAPIGHSIRAAIVNDLEAFARAQNLPPSKVDLSAAIRAGAFDDLPQVTFEHLIRVQLDGCKLPEDRKRLWSILKSGLAPTAHGTNPRWNATVAQLKAPSVANLPSAPAQLGADLHALATPLDTKLAALLDVVAPERRVARDNAAIGKAMVELMDVVERRNQQGQGLRYPGAFPDLELPHGYDIRTGYADPKLFDKVGDFRFRVKTGASPSQAITAFLTGPSAVECNVTIQAVMLGTLLRVVGPQEFDRLFSPPRAPLELMKTYQAKDSPLQAFLRVSHHDPAQASHTGARGVPSGAWVYFQGAPDYAKVAPNGFWVGANSIASGDEHFMYLGSGSWESEQHILEGLASAYNHSLLAYQEQRGPRAPDYAPIEVDALQFEHDPALELPTQASATWTEVEPGAVVAAKVESKTTLGGVLTTFNRENGPRGLFPIAAKEVEVRRANGKLVASDLLGGGFALAPGDTVTIGKPGTPLRGVARLENPGPGFQPNNWRGLDADKILAELQRR